jgi:hypothetical protein
MKRWRKVLLVLAAAAGLVTVGTMALALYTAIVTMD